MRTLIQVLQAVEVKFLTDEHLDTEPYADPVFISGTSVLRNDANSDDDVIALAKRDHQIVQNLLAINRERREAEISKPVTRIEVELVDNYVGDADWNITYADLDALSRSTAFQHLTQTAAEKGFGFAMHSEVHLNRKQVLSLRVTLVFKSFEAFKYNNEELLHGETGRTYLWYEHP